MQLDFFETKSTPPRPPLELVEHVSAFYGPRTGENARAADVTVAFAVDFSTAGEKLTAKAAGSRYIGILFGSPVDDAARELAAFLQRKEARTINVAGNGIYTLKKRGHTQEFVNEWVYRVLRRALHMHPLEHLRSGGQTGIDQAGLVAALALGVPATGLYPKGFIQRNSNGEDKAHSQQELLALLELQAAAVKGLTV